MAMLMGAGIPVEKADHPSLRGFLRKYTAIEGMLHNASTLRKPVNVTYVMGSHRRSILFCFLVGLVPHSNVNAE